jgi:hypothetical protein
LYCVGTAHSGGYLGTLRLDADVLDRNFHQVLYAGFLNSFGPILLALFAYSGARLDCAGIDLATKTIYYFPQNGHSYQYAAPAPIAGPASAASRGP